MRTARSLALGATLALFAFATPASAQQAPAPAQPQASSQALERRTFAWDKETIGLFAEIAVQEGGRVKPLDTLAGFKLLKIAGRRSCEGPEGTLAPVPWLLDCLFFPEQAVGYPCFLVQNAEALDRIGLAHEGKRKRDRYTYSELQPGIQQLYALADELSKKEEKERDSAENQVVLLAHNVHDFEQLIHFLDFARTDFSFKASAGLQKVYPADAHGLAVAISKGKLLVELFHSIEQAPNIDPKRKEEELQAIKSFVSEIVQAAQPARALALFAPEADVKDAPEWLTPSDLTQVAFSMDMPIEKDVAMLQALQDLEHAKGDLAAFKAKARVLHDGLQKLAGARGEYSKVPLEVAFYKGDFFYRALLLFVLAFVLAAFSWTKPTSKILHRGSLGATALGLLLVLTGIVLRCIIRSRPPVSTLYETILFITGMAVLTCLVVEGLNRQRIASSVAAFLGMMGMFLATKYEFKESVTAGDTMPSLVAVLDTNFWLATHVTSVTMGYSAGLLAAALAHVWLFGQMLGIRKGDTKFFRNIQRMIYGVLCFGLLFSTVGTILGGIWANYSWGRFWGWDPKENGALMICLWELIIFHARLGGYIRDYGIAIMTILGGCVIGFSWWGVNLLGVGLHSYGFTSGIYQILVGAYVVEALVILLSAGWWLAGQGRTLPAPAAPAPPTEPASPPAP